MILLLSLLLQVTSALAAPVFNQSVPAGEDLVIYPDQFDPNLFYFTSKNLGVPKTPGGFPEVRINFRPSYFGPFRVGSQPGLEVDLKPDDDSRKLETAFNLIISKNPLARFKKLTADRSMIVLNPNSDHFFSSIECSVEVASGGVQTSCTYWLTEVGQDSLLPSLMAGAPFMVSVEERYEGVVHAVDGSYEPFRKSSIISSAFLLMKVDSLR